jgi:hypothetical protein
VPCRTTRTRSWRPSRGSRAVASTVRSASTATTSWQKTGPAASLRTNALNEAKLQVYEALNNGAYEAVVQRLAPAAAAKSYAVVNIGSGAILTVTVVAAP